MAKKLIEDLTEIAFDNLASADWLAAGDSDDSGKAKKTAWSAFKARMLASADLSWMSAGPASIAIADQSLDKLVMFDDSANAFKSLLPAAFTVGMIPHFSSVPFADFTLDSSHHLKLISNVGMSGALNITLPAASTVSTVRFGILNAYGSAYPINLIPNGSERIGPLGAGVTLSLPDELQYLSFRAYSGFGWYMDQAWRPAPASGTYSLTGTVPGSGDLVLEDITMTGVKAGDNVQASAGSGVLEYCKFHVNVVGDDTVNMIVTNPYGSEVSATSVPVYWEVIRS